MELLGVKIDNFSLIEVLQKIQGFLVDGGQHQIATVNPEFIVLAQKDREFREILNRADLNVADGFGIVLAARLTGKKIMRVAGVDLIENLRLRLGNNKIFLFGGENGAAEKAARDWPVVIGFSENPENAVELINGCQPDILLVALGAPKQEKWITQNLAKIPSVKVAIGVGGAFKFLSGQVRRAPRWLRRIGLEWAWRTIMEPSRIMKVWRSVIVFGWLVIKTRVAAAKDAVG